MNKFFYCYNVRLSLFLQAKGFKYNTKARHLSNGAIFTQFNSSPELTEAIAQYKTIFPVDSTDDI